MPRYSNLVSSSATAMKFAIIILHFSGQRTVMRYVRINNFENQNLRFINQ